MGSGYEIAYTGGLGDEKFSRRFPKAPKITRTCQSRWKPASGLYEPLGKPALQIAPLRNGAPLNNLGNCARDPGTLQLLSQSKHRYAPLPRARSAGHPGNLGWIRIQGWSRRKLHRAGESCAK
jgi:hypothetical protein